MSTQNRSFELSKTASEDLSGSQYYIVQMDSAGAAELAEGALDFIIGVLQNKPESGQEAHVRFLGVSKVKIGGTVNIGDFVTTNSTAEGIATTTDGDIVIGRAITAGVDGDVIEVQMSIEHLYIA